MEARAARRPPAGRAARPSPRRPSQVLAGTHPLDGATAPGLLGVGQEGAHVDDALALLARDPRPVVGVGGVGQVLVLLVLPADRLHQVRGADPAALARDLPLDGELLGPADDVLDHGPRGEVAVVQHLFVAVLVGDLEELVLVVGPVHLRHGVLDHGLDRLGGVASPEALDLLGVDGEVGGQVPGEDLGGGLLVRAARS